MASMNLEPIHFTDLKDNINNDKSPLLGAIFLFFLIFFTFLFVYFLYICTHRRHVDGGGNPTTPPGAAGLDPATISGLPVFSYGSSDKKPSPGAECAICLSLFQEDEKVKVLPLCRHGFHADCVDKWLRTRSNCPLCRACIHRPDSLSRELDSELP
ncbi:hypothetical protein BUALT_Bualt11G0131900 [Buddleja alternifolia]|uniref:RING-type domain-containing protein n=1 Tax=Buddleja alternifolia TaxID=168488 RepID=A0AAV6WWG6_9LAMI|nr:hypothetical protein BUALT_Bualt11G0131900 [Buddleja alternifolia]